MAAVTDLAATRYARHREARCTRTSPLPLLPSGPGGVGGIASRGTRYLTGHSNKVVAGPAPIALDARRLGIQWRNLLADMKPTATLITTRTAANSAVERYFEVSLFLLIATG